jgi:hypothetical protein
VNIAGALSIIAGGAHALTLAGIVSGSPLVPLSLYRLQSTLLTGMPLLWAAAAVTCFLLTRGLPRVTSVVDSLLPCGWLRLAKRRNSDAGTREGVAGSGSGSSGGSGSKRERASANGADGDPWVELADNIHVGFLAIAWHLTMAGAIVSAQHDKQMVNPGGFVGFMVVAVAVGAALAALAARDLQRSPVGSGVRVSALRLALPTLASHAVAAALLFAAFSAAGGYATLSPFSRNG